MIVWVFGYGSLIEKTGFKYEVCETACLADYHRSFWMRLIQPRDTPGAPDLVIAIDKFPDAQCNGSAQRLPVVR